MWHNNSFLQEFILKLDLEIIGWFENQKAIPEILKQSMQYAVCNGGKRLRPLLMATCSQIFNLSLEQILAPAMAIEFIHAYSLIHDDLPSMDNSATRRGMASCWKKYGEAFAILAGDALLTSAFEVITSSPLKPESQLKLIQYLSKCSGACGMVAGQVLDMATEINEKLRSQKINLEELSFLKTGKLLQFCCLAPAIISHQHELLPSLELLGKNLGLIYQIVDDLLDQSGDAKTMGKPSQQDSKKITFASLLGQEKAMQMVDMLKQDSLQILKNLPGDKKDLKNLIDFLINRRS